MNRLQTAAQENCETSFEESPALLASQLFSDRHPMIAMKDDVMSVHACYWQAIAS
jgi:hypothetical protein